MRNFIVENFKYLIPIIIGILLFVIISDMINMTNGMSKEDRKRIEMINNDINTMLKYQKQLDQKITNYNIGILKIDSTITNIKFKKEVVTIYYQQKSEAIKNSNIKQIDSLLRSRYKF
jgi:hypothetical protein